MKYRYFLFLSLLISTSLQLTGCVSASFSDTEKFKEDKLRAASPQEAQKIDQCLYSIYKLQQQYQRKTGKYFSTLESLPLSEICQQIKVSMKSDINSYKVIARMKDKDKSTVKWSLNDKGTVFEHDEYDALYAF